MNPIVEKVYQIGIIPVIAFNSVDEIFRNIWERYCEL